MSRPSVAVVGGGVVGLACAWELHKGGATVTVVERRTVGSGASGGNTGWVVPSLSLPLPAPGMVREGLRQLVTRGDAFVLKPSLDPSFVRWLWQFHRSCTPTRFDAGIRALLALNRRTLELFDRYRDEGIGFEMHATGLVIAARSAEGLGHFRTLFHRLGELGYEGSEARELTGRELVELEPALDERSVVAGLHARVDRYVRPESLVAGLAERLRADGVRVFEHCESTLLERRNGCWKLSTTGSEIEADRVVLAAGLATRRLLPHSAGRPGLAPARGFSVTIQGAGTPPRHALYLAEARLGLSPYERGVRVAGVFELGASGTEAPPDVGEKLLAAAAPYLSGWRPEPDGPVTTWAGLRPATADGLPLIGEVPDRPGVYVAAGHGMLGVTLAPATAALLAPVVLRGEVAPELRPFDPARTV